MPIAEKQLSCFQLGLHSSKNVFVNVNHNEKEEDVVSVFDLMIEAMVRAQLGDCELNLCREVAREHLGVKAGADSQDVVEQMAADLLRAIKAPAHTWPPLDSVVYTDMESVERFNKEAKAHMHHVLEQLGYGPYPRDETACDGS